MRIGRGLKGCSNRWSVALLKMMLLRETGGVCVFPSTSVKDVSLQGVGKLERDGAEAADVVFLA